jgi:hypothetical protein
MKRARIALSLVGWLALAVAVTLSVAWVAVHARGPIARLSPPDELVLYSILGVEYLDGAKPEGEAFHDYPVLGKVVVTDPQARDAIMAAFEQGVSAGDKLAFCFFPRHALRVTKNGQTVDFAVCFECHQLRMYGDGEPVTLPITRAPQEVFNRHLTAAGIRLAPGMVSAE